MLVKVLKTSRLIWKGSLQLRKISISPNQFAKEAVILGIYSNKDGYPDGKLEGTPSFEKIDSETGGKLRSLLENSKPLKPGSCRQYYGITKQYNAVSVVSFGDKDPITDSNEGLDTKKENIRKAIGAGMKSISDFDIEKVAVDTTDDPTAAAEGAFLSSWSYKQSERDKMPGTIIPLGDGGSDWEEGKVLAEGQNFARFLMESPANLMTPTIFTELVKEKFETCGSQGEIEIHIRNEDWIKDQKMGAFLSVAKGSDELPKFLEIHYKGPKAPVSSRDPIVMIGKGVTFDSGGISIKPSRAMDEMRADMGGAATVSSAILTAAKLNLPQHIIGLTPLCENMLNGKATKPGDVVTAMNGTTIQVDNTDAEGRLLLADALCYSGKFNPSAIIDVATLTFAIVASLGAGAAGAFTNCNELWNTLNTAGFTAGDRIWRMPLYQLYADQIKPTALANINNVGRGERTAGACTAAAFLNHFVPPGSRWCHLDIAGVMMNTKEVPYISPGMAGRPTRTFVEFLKGFSR